MATPNAAPPSHLELYEQVIAAEQRERLHRIAAGAGVLAWLAATFLPFDDLLGGLVVGLGCLAGVALTAIVMRKAWPERAPGPAVVLLGSAALTAFIRFAVPAFDSDSLLVRIGAYVAFCAIYVGFNLLGQRLMGFGEPVETRPGYSFWRQFAFTFAVLGMLISALYLLARFFSLTLLLLLVAANLLTLLTTHVARKAVGSEATDDRRLAWASTELFASRPMLGAAVTLLPMVAWLAFPVVIGAVYFTMSVPSDELTTWVFRLTLIGLFFSSLPLGVFALSSTLASPNVNEPLRVRQLVIALSALINVGLLLSLLLWSFGVGTEDELTSSAPGVSFSPAVVITLLAYFFLAVFIPYAIGTTRSRRQLLRFLGVIRAAMARVTAALERPHAAGLESELERARIVLQRVEVDSMRENAVLALAEEGERLEETVADRLPPVLATQGLRGDQLEIYQRMRADELSLTEADDPRLRFWGQLRALRGGIDEIAFTLEHAPAADRTRLRLEWAEFLTKRRRELEEYIAERPRTRLPAWLTLGGLVAPVVSVILDQFGNWIWIQIADSFPG